MNELGQFLTSHAGVVLFLAILAEQIGIPVPAAPVLVAAGALATDGALSLSMAIAITVAACAPGDLMWYYAGRRRGKRVPELLRRIFPGDRSFRLSERFFNRFGIAAVAGAKFVPGVSFLIPALAGAFKINLAKFLWFDLLGSLLYGIFYIQVGAIFSNEISGAMRTLSGFGLWIALVVVGSIAVFAICQYAQIRRAAKLPSSAAASVMMAVSQV
jgi:membrane protein DedA with SNARE-associated domain